jgi:hypothetical protein
MPRWPCRSTPSTVDAGADLRRVDRYVINRCRSPGDMGVVDAASDPDFGREALRIRRTPGRAVRNPARFEVSLMRGRR